MGGQGGYEQRIEVIVKIAKKQLRGVWSRGGVAGADPGFLERGLKFTKGVRYVDFA